VALLARHLAAGRVRLQEARAETDPGRRAAAARQAVEAFSAAIAIDAAEASLWGGRAGRGPPSSGDRDAAKRDLAEAKRLQPGDDWSDLEKQVRAVIFDLDGTLADTLGDIHASLNHALAVSGLAPVGRATARRESIGGGVSRLIERIVDDAGQRGRVEASFPRHHYAEHLLDVTTLYPGGARGAPGAAGAADGRPLQQARSHDRKIVEGLAIAEFFRPSSAAIRCR